ncbi:RNA polymerase sigma factor, partial [Actinosynnema sp.]|uniref:RNA polymerase sigma factor n=1 Tax=Actinosynnema sp. TaxID=1872144 RepID=UPI003F87E83E
MRAGLLDEDAVERLHSGTAGRLHRCLARRVGVEIADDLVAEAFLVLWRDRAGSPHEPDATAAWLYGVAANLVRRHVRTEERRLRAWTREHARTGRARSCGRGSARTWTG